MKVYRELCRCSNESIAALEKVNRSTIMFSSCDDTSKPGTKRIE